MEFGVKPAEGGQRFEATVEQTQTAEEYGFETVFLSEHSGFPGAGYWPHPILGLAGLARGTETIELSTSISLLPLTNPVEMAGEIALLDVISDGRATLGFGAGWRKEEYDAFGVPFEERAERMTEYLDIVTSLLEPGPTTYEGGFYSFEAFELTPRPVQKPRPDILVGGVGKAALERAVEFGAGWITPTGEIDELARHAEHFREAGVDRIVANIEGIVIREDPAEARRLGREFMRRQKKPLFEARSEYASGEFDLEAELGQNFEEYIDRRSILVGTPDECTEHLERIASATGCDQFVCRISTQGWDHERAMNTLDLLGTDVLPSF